MSAAVPAGLFFAAGAAAAFNPCGAAMLPAYVALLLGGGARGSSGWAGLAAGAAMTGGFLTVFGLAGAAGALALPLLGRSLPYLGLAVGAGLVGLGAWLLTGRALPAAHVRLADRWAPGRGGGMGGAYVYGVAYALASLGCTFPLFAALIAGVLSSGSALAGLAAFVLYAAGMGAVVTAVSLAATLARQRLGRWLNAVLAGSGRLAGGVVALMGLYLLHYWLQGPGAALLRG